MSKLLAFFLFVAFVIAPRGVDAQVLKTSKPLQRGTFALSGSPTVFMDDGTNDIAMFVYGTYGLGGGTNLRVRAGFFESDNYIGGNIEWTLRQATPSISFSLGGHYVNDPAADATLNLALPKQNGLEWYAGLDLDLIFDDDPDMPVWVFAGLSYDLLDSVDILIEFNYGIVEIAPHILAAGFVFYF